MFHSGRWIINNGFSHIEMAMLFPVPLCKVSNPLALSCSAVSFSNPLGWLRCCSLVQFHQELKLGDSIKASSLEPSCSHSGQMEAGGKAFKGWLRSFPVSL